MAKVSLKDLDVSGKKVLVRVDYNVPIDASGVITNTKRIDASLKTVRYLLEKKASVILMSHLGRPKGKKVPSMSLAPVAKKLSELIKVDVKMAPDCIGPETKKMAGALKSGEVLLLENLRFHPEEEKNDDSFSKELASFGEIFIQEAFGTVHRAHASTAGIVKYVKQSGIGFLVEKELKFLGDSLNNPKRPFVALLGGAKVSDKIKVIENLLTKVDKLLIGGAMAYTFLKAKGVKVGKSLVEEDKLELAKTLLAKAGGKIELPSDHITADKVDFEKKEFPSGSTVKESGPEIPEGFMGVDIGPVTLASYRKILSSALTVMWNGPMGIFEIEKSAKGTVEIAKTLSEITKKGAITVIGGGDSASAVKKAGVQKDVSHVSTGGGASLEFLEGIELPGLAVIPEKK